MADAEPPILAAERAALDRWCKGDPSGFLELSQEGVSYFDPFQPLRLDGLQSLRSLYESLRGQVRVDRCELVNPRVQSAGDAAVLTFNFVSWTNGVISLF